MIWVFATDTVASVKSTWLPVESVSFRLVISVAPVGPKLVPVMVTVEPAVPLCVIEVITGATYFICTAFVARAPAVVPLTEIVKENVLVPAPAGAVKVISVFATDTVALLPAGVTAVEELSHTIFMMFESPTGPKLVPATVRVPPAVGTVVAIRFEESAVIVGPVKSRIPSPPVDAILLTVTTTL